MTDQNKKTRAMTPKMFLHRATSKAGNSAAAFLQAHREFLTTGKLAEKTYPIIQRIDAGSLYPTPGLEEVKVAVLNHMLNQEVEEARKIIEAPPTQTQSNKNYTATILNASGQVCTRINAKGEVEDLIQSFDDGEHATGWIDRRLFEGASTWHGELVHKSITVKGEPWVVIIERSDSIARILKQKKKAVTTQPKTTTARLSFGMKVKQDRASFSRG
jgi:hypothetical protein